MSVDVHLAIVETQTCLIVDWAWIGGNRVHEVLYEMTHLDHVGDDDSVESYWPTREDDVRLLIQHSYAGGLELAELDELFNRFPIERYTWQAVIT